MLDNHLEIFETPTVIFFIKRADFNLIINSISDILIQCLILVNEKNLGIFVTTDHVY